MSKIPGCANFDFREFYCPTVVGLSPVVRANVAILAKELQVFRDLVGRPVQVSSGWRSPAHNERVGGVKNSQHLTGKAVDFRVSKMTGPEIYHAIEALIKAGKMREGGLGCYDTWCHYDIREDLDGNPKKARWMGK